MLKTPRNSSEPYFKYSALGFQILSALLLGGYLGHRLDAYLAWGKSYFTLAGLLLGVSFSIYVGLKLFLRNKE